MNIRPIRKSDNAELAIITADAVLPKSNNPLFTAL